MSDIVSAVATAVALVMFVGLFVLLSLCAFGCGSVLSEWWTFPQTTPTPRWQLVLAAAGFLVFTIAALTMVVWAWNLPA